MQPLPIIIVCSCFHVSLQGLSFVSPALFQCFGIIHQLVAVVTEPSTCDCFVRLTACVLSDYIICLYFVAVLHNGSSFSFFPLIGLIHILNIFHSSGEHLYILNLLFSCCALIHFVDDWLLYTLVLI